MTEKIKILKLVTSVFLRLNYYIHALKFSKNGKTAFNAIIILHFTKHVDSFETNDYVNNNIERKK